MADLDKLNGYLASVQPFTDLTHSEFYEKIVPKLIKKLEMRDDWGKAG